MPLLANASGRDMLLPTITKSSMTVSPFLIRTREPACAVTVKAIGLAALVTLSWFDQPLSLAAGRSRVGRCGGIVSTVMLSGCARALTFPA